ncbi:MAG: dihydrolipoamide dehydrogenase [Sphingobacteriales bacterium]|jgi:dihydrolipoamide dehydrogenase
MKTFDCCIIGGGPSGFAATMRALDLGKKVALVEKNRLGGAGVFNGALSSKTLWELSEKYKSAHSGNHGFTVFDSELSIGSVMAEMNNAVSQKYRQLVEQCSFFVKTGQLTLFKGCAEFTGSHAIKISGEDNCAISADRFFMAVGSRPRKIPQIEVDEKTIFTSDGIHSLRDFPESIVILGAGVIGCEFATIFSNFGKTKVYLIDKQDRILPFEDIEISSLVASNLSKRGVTVHKECNLDKMSIVDGRVEYTLINKDGKKETITVEKALISIGRVPNTENLGLEKAGVEVNSRGFIDDKDTVTNVPHIHAIGDLTADIALVNIAELEGRHAVEMAYTNKKSPLEYNNISTIMFLNPEVAAVGMNEQQAKAGNVAYKMACVSYKYVNRAIAMRENEGFFKLLVTDDAEMKILGMRAVGPHASSTIQAVALLIALDKGIRCLTDVVHAHPSMPEGIQTCVRMLLGSSIIKPQVFTQDLQCYRVDTEGRRSPIYQYTEAELTPA